MTKNDPTITISGITYHADSCDAVRAAADSGLVRFSALARGTYPGLKLKRGELRGLRSIGYWDAGDQQKWGLAQHRNEGIELAFLESGSMPISIEGKKTFMTPDSLSVTRPWQPHSLGDPDVPAGRLYWAIIDVGVRQPHQEWKWPSWLVLSDNDRQELTKFLRHNEKPVWNAGEDVRRCFRKIGKSLDDTSDDGLISRVAVYVNELLLEILEMFRREDVPLSESLTDASRSVSLFLDILPDMITEPWTLELMADHCGLGVTRFVHYCKRLTNSTPMQHLNHIRLTVAAEMLKSEPSMNVTKIAAACGFSSGQYFSNVFRKRFGDSPGEYRTKKGK